MEARTKPDSVLILPFLRSPAKCPPATPYSRNCRPGNKPFQRPINHIDRTQSRAVEDTRKVSNDLFLSYFFFFFFLSFPHLCGKNRITTANIEKGEKLFYIKRRGIAVESSSLFRESNLTWRDHEEGGGGEEYIYYSTLLVTPLLVHFLVRERCTGAMYNYRG